MNSPDDKGTPPATLTLTARRKVLFTMLSVLWLFPSAGALCIILKDWKAWRRTGSVLEIVSSVRLEDWTAFLLLLAQITFIIQAIRYRRRNMIEEASAS